MVTPALPGRQSLTGRDWGLLLISMCLVVAGVALAFRFRPVDSVGGLRRRLAGSDSTVPDRAGDPTREGLDRR